MTSVETMKIPEGYKQTEVGVIPEDWGIEVLHNLVSSERRITYGIVVPGPYINNGVPLIRAQDYSRGWVDIDELYRVGTAIDKSYKRSKVISGDILLTIVGSVGKLAKVTPIFTGSNITQQTARLSFNEKVASQDFYFNLLKSESGKKEILNYTKSGVQPSLNLSDVEKFVVVCPPLKEQTAIANALSDVDNLIASLETLIAKKSAIKTAAMQQLLTGKKRLPAFVKQGAKQNSELDNTSETAQAAQTKQTSTLNSDLYKESSEGLDSKSNQQSEVSNANNKQTAPRPGYKQTELGEIPEDWSCIESLEAMHFFGGYGFSSNLASSTGVKWLKIANVGLNEIKWDAESFLPERLVNDYKDFLLKPTDVVMALTRPILADKLKVARIEEADIPALLNQRVAKIEPKSYHQLDYLYYVVQRLNFVAAMNLAMAGTDPPNIGTNALAKIKIISPPTKEEQTAIANVLSDMDTELDSLQQRLSKAQKIKQGMMQELLTGKTRLV